MMKVYATNQRMIYIRRRVLLLLAALLIVIGGSATSGAILHANAMNQDERKEHAGIIAIEVPNVDKSSLLSVEPGDTLWNIAKKYGPEDVGTKTYVQQIISFNGLDSANLQVGQVLRLP